MSITSFLYTTNTIKSNVMRITEGDTTRCSSE